MSKSLEKWKGILCHVFGKRARRNWKGVAIDLMAVAGGIKTALLFDQWLSSPEEMVKLLDVLYNEGLTVDKLELIVVDMDLLIYSRHLFLENFEHNSNVKFVDVSFSLDKPLLVEDNRIKDTSDTFVKFVDFVRSCQSRSRSDILSSSLNQSGLWYEVKVTDDDIVNPSCLFGLLLGYPSVYWFDKTGGCHDNCLSMQPLRLYQIKGVDISQRQCGASRLQTDLPVDSLNSSSDRMNARDWMCSRGKTEAMCNLSGKTCHFNHVLYSFTVPENVLKSETGTEDQVQDWFTRWKNLSRWKELFSLVWMEQRTVELQTVSL